MSKKNQAEKIFKEAETGVKLGIGIATASTVGLSFSNSGRNCLEHARLWGN